MAELVGVSPAYLQKLVQSGHRRHASEADLEKERICKRFFMALMLNDVIQEVSVQHIILNSPNAATCSLPIAVILNDVVQEVSVQHAVLNSTSVAAACLSH